MEIDPDLVKKFQYIQQSAKGNGGHKKKYTRLNDEFHLGNESDLKYLISSIYISVSFSSDDMFFSLDKTMDALSHYAKIFVDVNGLKAVNDWAGHAKGDILLRRIVECLLYDEAIIRFIKNFNLHFPRKNKNNSFDFVPYDDMCQLDLSKLFFQLFREGGDEFSMIIYSPDYVLNVFIPSADWSDDDYGQLSLIATLRALIIERVSMINIDDLLDDNCVINNLDKFGLRLYGATGGEFEFYASVAGGEVCFDTVLLNYLSGHGVFDIHYDQNFFGNTLMGAVQNFVDEQTTRRKIRYRRELACGSACERFEGYLITRSEEARRWFAIAEEVQYQSRDFVYRFCAEFNLAFVEIKKNAERVGSDEQLNKLINGAIKNLNLFAKVFPEILRKALGD
jgi:hypothetical protein